MPNILNRDFFSTLSKISRNNSQITIRLLLAKDLLGLPNSLSSWEQLDYWWGPKYNDDVFKIETGVSVHGASKHDIMFGRYKQTEFWWYQKDRRTLEIEEVLDEPVYLEIDGVKKIGMRFVHSIFDSTSKQPCHLDGAIRLYDYELFQKRSTTTIKEFGKSADRLKLWRVDGNFSIEDWYDLIHTFFRNNYMVAEYFGFTPDDLQKQK